MGLPPWPPDPSSNSATVYDHDLYMTTWLSMRQKPTRPNNLRIVFWCLALVLIGLIVALFVIPALLSSTNTPSTSNSPQQPAHGISATQTVIQHVIGAVEASWTATANAGPEPT